MINPDGSPNTAHTTNPVPVILVDAEKKNIKSGILGDTYYFGFDGSGSASTMTQNPYF